MEPILYRWIGVGLVKRLVTSRAWLMLVGLELPQKPTSRHELLTRIRLWTMGAEVCHGAAFVFASSIATLCLVFDRISTGIWIIAFNIALNGYPIMFQRSIRWRVQKAGPRRDSSGAQ